MTNVRRVFWRLSEASGIPIDRDQAHDLLKRVFLGVEKTPLGEVPRHSSSLTVEEFGDYCTKIQAYAASEWGLTIPGPHEIEIHPHGQEVA